MYNQPLEKGNIFKWILVHTEDLLLGHMAKDSIVMKLALKYICHGFFSFDTPIL